MQPASHTAAEEKPNPMSAIHIERGSGPWETTSATSRAVARRNRAMHARRVAPDSNDLGPNWKRPQVAR
eukprot:550634-Alexandrium_andersonii.AAC.1